MCVGIDVSPHKLDVAVSGQDGGRTVPYTKAGLRRVLSLVKQSEAALVCREATGGLERARVGFLQAHGIDVAVANPRPIRDLTRAMGPARWAGPPKPMLSMPTPSRRSAS